MNPDHTVTFSLLAKEARKVELIVDGNATPLSRQGGGIWTATVGPWPPDIYRYNFSVDGLPIPDPSNPVVDPGRGRPQRSVIEVPGSPPRFDEWQSVPHGQTHVIEYDSAVLHRHRRALVYLPPRYDSRRATAYPTLYLRHGSGDLEDGWTVAGHAGLILENLLARQQAVPMVIVMPNGYPSETGDGAGAGIELTARELMSDLIPLIENTYHVGRRPDDRAIAGLSMGGGQAFYTGLLHLDTFASIGAFSSGGIGAKDFRLEAAIPHFLDDPSATNKRVKLLFLSCGTEDPRYPGYLDLVDNLKSHHIHFDWFSAPGAHEWKVWRQSLAAMIPKLFRAGA